MNHLNSCVVSGFPQIFCIHTYSILSNSNKVFAVKRSEKKLFNY